MTDQYRGRNLRTGVLRVRKSRLRLGISKTILGALQRDPGASILVHVRARRQDTVTR